MTVTELYGVLEKVWEAQWIEVSFALFFILGYAVLRLDQIVPRLSKRLTRDKLGGAGGPYAHPAAREQLVKSVEAEACAENHAAVLDLWRASRDGEPMPADVLAHVAEALLAESPKTLVRELSAEVSRHAPAPKKTKALCTLLEILARGGHVELMEELEQTCVAKLGVPLKYQVFEIMLGGYAAAGREDKVKRLFDRMAEEGQKPTARGWLLVIKGFLRNQLGDAALEQVKQMRSRGFYVPSFALTLLFHVFCEQGRTAELLDATQNLVTLPSDSVAHLLEDCLKRHDHVLALRIERLARETEVLLTNAAYDSLLKVLAVAGEHHAIEVFEELRAMGSPIQEGLCVGLLARCAESKFLRFAEEIVRHLRESSGMSIQAYSALMKVYAFSGLYDKACDLYTQIRAEGLEPDATMYGCLMKFSVECGRTELSRELFGRSPSLDIQSYMSAIRAAGRDRDVGRAFAVLEKLEASGVRPDIAIYNCILDVCVTTGDMARAHELVDQMRSSTVLDVITYNTLLKGYCSSGNIRAARKLLSEMEAAGTAPNDVSYNCLVNAAVSRGSLAEAWSLVDEMESKGVPVDHYTVSIMMKAMRRAKHPRDLGRALGLLDRSGIEVCNDEVLLNNVLETCIKHRELSRLGQIIAAFDASTLKPSVHTYGSLIKAASTLKWIEKCRALWEEMTATRALQPNDIVLGCMLDALVCNEGVEDAVAMCRAWKSRIPPNAVMYSTLIKGFANLRQAPRAMDMYRELRADGVPMNSVAYNALVDSQARVGDMEQVTRLVEEMTEDGITPDVITYSTIVKGYCVKGDLDRALSVFRGIQRDKLAREAIVYNTILDGCISNNRTDVAEDLLRDMEAESIAPTNFTLGILVKMYGRARQLDKAFQVMDSFAQKYNLAPNKEVMTCLISACLSNHSAERAYEVFERMKNASYGADSKAYQSMIMGLMRIGRAQDAVALIEEAFGVRPGAKGGRLPQPLETETLESVLRMLAQQGLTEQLGVPLLEQLHTRGCRVDPRIFTRMVRSAVMDHPRRRGGVGRGGSPKAASRCGRS